MKKPDWGTVWVILLCMLYGMSLGFMLCAFAPWGAC